MGEVINLDLVRDMRDVPGKPGTRRDHLGQEWYSSTWLSNGNASPTVGDIPVAEAFTAEEADAVHAGRSVGEARSHFNLPPLAELDRHRALETIRNQAATLPADRHIGPRRRIDGTPLTEEDHRRQIERLTGDGLKAALRHLDRLVDMAPDATERSILKKRRRRLRILIADFDRIDPDA